ncbi:MAG: hypothetical protein QXO16_05565 [Archaeoglobaceae archaeon]
MKWRTHIAIAKEISKALNLPRELERELCEGIVEPDKFPDEVWKVGRRGRLYRSYMSHHSPEIGVIMDYIWNARLSYLKGDDLRAMRSLGRALHYVQDMSVSKGFLGLSHDSKEEIVSSLKTPREAIEKGIRGAVNSPRYVKNIVNSVKPKKDPNEAMLQACMVSAAIAKAVISEKEPSEELIMDFKLAKERYESRTIPIAMLVSILVFVFFFSIHPILSLLAILAGYVVQRMDTRYHELKEMARWFGIERIEKSNISKKNDEVK